MRNLSLKKVTLLALLACLCFLTAWIARDDAGQKDTLINGSLSIVAPADGIVRIDGSGTLLRSDLALLLSRRGMMLSELHDVVIGDGIASIGFRCFSGCTLMESVRLGDSVESISSFAFSDCAGLTHVYWPSAIREVGKGAFNNCPSFLYLYTDGDGSLVRDTFFSPAVNTFWYPAFIQQPAFFWISDVTSMSDLKAKTPVCSFDNRSLTAEGCEMEPAIRLAPGYVQHGPYLRFPGGTFHVSIYGSGLDSMPPGAFYIHLLNGTLDMEKVVLPDAETLQLSESKTEYDVALSETELYAELVTWNPADNDTVVTVSSIECVQTDWQCADAMNYWFE